MLPSREFSRLVEIMTALRDRNGGCPWDLEQDFSTIAPYTIEEAYEVADAIERGDHGDLCEELGDLLLQPVYHAQMAREDGLFDIGDVIEAITTKLIRRHPHVFGDEDARAAGMAKGHWERIKAEERVEKAAARGGDGEERPASVLDDVPYALPALSRAFKLQKRAARVGFDWDDPEKVLDKIAEEIDEVREATSQDEKADEIGDLLFAVANLARHYGIDPETALSGANAKFSRRFRAVEVALVADGRSAEAATLDEMEALWQQVKREEPKAG